MSLNSCIINCLDYRLEVFIEFLLVLNLFVFNNKLRQILILFITNQRLNLLNLLLNQLCQILTLLNNLLNSLNFMPLMIRKQGTFIANYLLTIFAKNILNLFMLLTKISLVFTLMIQSLHVINTTLPHSIFIIFILKFKLNIFL